MTGPEIAADGASPVGLDVAAARIRQPVDLVRLAVLVVLLMLAGVGPVASHTVRGAGLDLARLVRWTPDSLIRLFGVLGAVSALAVPVGPIVMQIARGHSRRLDR